jgi:sulfatase modifying factor 1
LKSSARLCPAIDIYPEFGNHRRMTHRALPYKNGAADRASGAGARITRASRRGRFAFPPAVLAIAAAAAAGSGCLAILGDFDEPAEGPASAASTSSASASSSGGGSGGAAASSSASGGGGGAASSSAAGTGGSSGGGPCPSEHGPLMILVPGPNGSGDYCVDSTEVTRVQYDAWLKSLPDPATDQPDYCLWNTSHEPKDSGACQFFDIETNPNHPIACVNWCDAYAYCAWAGKRLCGKIGGGSNDYFSHSNPSIGQWFRACSGAAASTFPYGNNYDGTKCIGSDHDGTPGYNLATDVPVEVGTADCKGGYPGLRDMSGNIYEWEDACEAYTSEAEKCAVRGGSYEDEQNVHRCDTILGAARGEAKNERGFRCCAEAIPTP